MNTVLTIALFIVVFAFISWLFSRVRDSFFATPEQDARFSEIDTELRIEATPYFHRGWSFHLFHEERGWYAMAYRGRHGHEIRTPFFSDPFAARDAVERAIDELES